jgi:hypothetical protein
MRRWCLVCLRASARASVRGWLPPNAPLPTNARRRAYMEAKPDGISLGKENPDHVARVSGHELIKISVGGTSSRHQTADSRVPHRPARPAQTLALSEMTRCVINRAPLWLHQPARRALAVSWLYLPMQNRANNSSSTRSPTSTPRSCASARTASRSSTATTSGGRRVSRAARAARKPSRAAATSAC